MISYPIENVNVAAFELMPSPDEIKLRVPVTDRAAQTVIDGRETLKRIIERKDHRLFVVVGPCSIHDYDAAIDYATRLAAQKRELAADLIVVMRVYFEKPRTSTGWKGFINDPHLDDSFHIEEGMQRAREFLLSVA